MKASALQIQLDRIAACRHISEGLRKHIATQVALARAFSESTDSETGAAADTFYRDLLERLLLLFDFSLEHAREDTRKTLDELFALAMAALSPHNDLRATLARGGDAFEKMQAASERYFTEMLPRYHLDLQKLRQKCDLMHEDLSCGLSAPLQAVYEKFPDSQVIESARAQLADFSRHLKFAEDAFRPGFSGEFNARWERFRRAGRAYERAKYFGLRFNLRPALSNRHVIDRQMTSLRETGNSVERLNNAYYKLRGAGIYEDFFTKASADPWLAAGDARHFYRRVRRLIDQGKKLPEMLQVVECGVGDGKFAADFLDHIALLDLQAATKDPAFTEHDLLYPRIRYTLLDVSAKMLDDARQNAHLAKHGDVVAYRSITDQPLWPASEEPIFYARFHELFDDLPRAPLIYIDAQGGWHELLTKLALRADAIIRERDYSGGDAEKFVDHLRTGDFAGFEHFHPENLSAVEVICELRPVKKAAQLAKDLAHMAQGFTDVIFPANLGAVAFLENVINRLSPEFGWASIFDYGYKHLSLLHHRDHYYTSQLNRRFGGSLTNDVAFPLLALAAKSHPMRTTICLQERYVALTTESEVVDTRPFVPDYSGRSLIRHVSVPEGIFRLEFLKAYDDLKKLALRHRQKNRTEKNFQAFLKAARDRGYIGEGAAIVYLPLAVDELDNLACELDFWVNGIYRCLVGKDTLHWLPLRHPFVMERLSEMGFDAEKIFANVYTNPAYGALWVLSVWN